MFRNLTTTWKDEIVKNNLLAKGDRPKVEFLYPMHGLGDTSPGSNAWAISGAHTASGKPILSNDMHLEYSLPGIWHMASPGARGLCAGVAFRRARHCRGTQSAHRVGHYESALRRAGPLYRKV
jgi:penicillin amidase